jgi:uncharacterized membrane protein SpoIIM required for sporulation
VILDLEQFIVEQQGTWRELDTLLGKLESDPGAKMDLEQVKRFHLLYQRTSADLGKLHSFACEPELKRYLESLVARAFGEVHETRRRAHRLAPLVWFLRTFPQTFRRRIGAFWLVLAVTLMGALFGTAALLLDSDAKEVLMPFEHLTGSPVERVAKEEQGINAKKLEDHKMTFSSQLMTHNIRVAVLCMAMGATWGLGTLILLFYNGVILGAVAVDYVSAGQSVFLVGWLLPHGSVEIPAIMLAGQAGLVLAGALLGRRSGLPLTERFRQVTPDLTTLIGGAAVLLVWAGIIEAFFSQYHQPVVPYSLKISFGVLQLAALVLFLSQGGQGTRVIRK